MIKTLFIHKPKTQTLRRGVNILSLEYWKARTPGSCQYTGVSVFRVSQHLLYPVSLCTIWRFPNTGEIPFHGSCRSGTPYFVTENSQQRWLPETKRNWICRMTKYDVWTAKFQFPYTQCIMQCSYMFYTQWPTEQSHMSLLHLPTPSTLVSSV